MIVGGKIIIQLPKQTEYYNVTNQISMLPGCLNATKC